MREKTIDKLMKILDDYYGDCRDNRHKEEIIDFLEVYHKEVNEIIEEGE